MNPDQQKAIEADVKRVADYLEALKAKFPENMNNPSLLPLAVEMASAAKIADKVMAATGPIEKSIRNLGGTIESHPGLNQR